MRTSKFPAFLMGFALLTPSLTDRSTVLPPETVRWKTEIAGGFPFDRDRTISFYPGWVEHGLSEKWTLIWHPFPFAVRHRLTETKRLSAAIEFSLIGAGFQYEDGFTWRPSLIIDFLARQSERRAVLLETLLQLDVDRINARGVSGVVGTRVSPILQLHPRFAIAPTMAIYLEHGVPGGRYVGWTPSGSTGQNYKLRARFPFGAYLHWMPLGWFETTFRYEYFYFGHTDGSTAHQAALTFSTYW